MSSLSRMLSVLNLFSAEHSRWDAEKIAEAIGCSTTTGYRYVKELMQAGLLQRVPGGTYALGPRIALLNYIIRSSDPLLQISIPVMRELVDHADCRCILSRMDGMVLLDLHHEGVPHELQLTYGPGRPRPLFKGGAPKVILANLPTRKLRSLYNQRAEEIDVADMGSKWTDFQANLLKIRRDGFYFSHGEIEADFSSVTVPVALADKDSYAALTLVMPSSRLELMDKTKLLVLMHNASQQIPDRMTAL